MRFKSLLAAGAAVILLAGCGADDDAAGGGSAATAGWSGPVTVESKFGTATIERPPKRVAVVGLREIDDLLALDIVPVLTTKYVNIDDDVGVRPWAKAALGDRKAPPAVDTTTDGIPVERVAASRPDLIVGRFSGMTKGEYEQLSKIAPVLAQPAGYADYGEPWQEEMRAVGKAVGKADEAEELVTDAEAEIAQARKAHPEFEGKTGLVATPYQGVFVYGPEDPRGRLLGELGLKAPDGVADVVGDEFGAQLSGERQDLLDADALIWLIETAKQKAEIAANPVYAKLPVAKRAIFSTPQDTFYAGASALTVLNVEPVLDEIVPQLAKAVKAG